jgi:hypothetical protein
MYHFKLFKKGSDLEGLEDDVCIFSATAEEHLPIFYEFPVFFKFKFFLNKQNLE